MEVEALFYSELKKVYKDDMDGTEAHEDLARMREYAMSEVHYTSGYPLNRGHLFAVTRPPLP